MSKIVARIKFKPWAGYILKPIWFFQAMFGFKPWVPSFAITVKVGSE